MELFDQGCQRLFIVIGSIGHGVAHIGSAECGGAGCKLINPGDMQEFEIAEVADVFFDAPLIMEADGCMFIGNPGSESVETWGSAAQALEDIENPAFGE